MTKTKIWLIVAAALSLLGIIILASVMILNKWDFTKFSTVKFETNSYEITEDFNDISLKTDTANILFVASDTDKVQIFCHERSKIPHTVSVKDGKLLIEANDLRKWYEHIEFFSFDKTKITVYMPRGEYGTLSVSGSTGDTELPEGFNFSDIDIKVSTGDIKVGATSEKVKLCATTGDIFVENATVESLDLCVSTGKINISRVDATGDIARTVSTGDAELVNVNCKNLISDGSTGDITLTSVIAIEKMNITRSTGDVRLEASDATEISITTDTGSVTGRLLSEKIIFAMSDTGRIDVPKTTGGGRCEITTDTGNIKIEIE